MVSLATCSLSPRFVSSISWLARRPSAIIVQSCCRAGGQKVPPARREHVAARSEPPSNPSLFPPNGRRNGKPFLLTRTVWIPHHVHRGMLRNGRDHAQVVGVLVLVRRLGLVWREFDVVLFLTALHLDLERLAGVRPGLQVVPEVVLLYAVQRGIARP